MSPPFYILIGWWSTNEKSRCMQLEIFFDFIFIAVSGQVYESHTFHETVILGNDAIFKCSIPSFVSDFVTVLGWVDSQGTELGNPTGSFNFQHFI